MMVSVDYMEVYTVEPPLMNVHSLYIADTSLYRTKCCDPD